MLLCILGGIGMQAQAKKYTMSVIVTGNVTDAARDIVSSAFMQRLSGNSDYVVFERNKAFLDALTKEQEYQVNGTVPESEIRSLGSRMGVDYVAVVQVEFVMENVFMTARIINIETAQIIKSCTETREYENPETLQAMSNMLAYRLFSKNSK